jgi:hypothetical protein
MASTKHTHASEIPNQKVGNFWWFRDSDWLTVARDIDTSRLCARRVWVQPMSITPPHTDQSNKSVGVRQSGSKLIVVIVLGTSTALRINRIPSTDRPKYISAPAGSVPIKTDILR